MPRSYLTILSKFLLCAVLLMGTILPLAENVVLAASVSQDIDQSHQVFLPLVSKGGQVEDENLITAAGVARRNSRSTPANSAKYTDDEIILTGSSQGIVDCLTAIGLINTPSLTGKPNELVKEEEFTLNRSSEYVIQIYNISSSLVGKARTIEKIIRDINSPSKSHTAPGQQNPANNSIGSCQNVVAEPNYIYTLGGSQWSTGGSNGDGAMVNAEVNFDDFKTQSAFRQIGVTPRDGFTSQHAPIIGVFDTMPDTLSDSLWNSVKLHGDYMTSSQETDGEGCESRDIIQEHGINVTSLLKATAPENSAIHLYRVLNQCAEGDLFSLMQALQDFRSEYTDNNNSLRVINMSLGGDPVPEMFDETGDGTPYALRELLNSMQVEGFVLVASSGNGSDTTEVKPSQWPASFDSVLSVAASNASGQRACYSNQGDIAAPGGSARAWSLTGISNSPPRGNLEFMDTDGNSITIGKETCEPQMDKCATDRTKCIIAQTSTEGGFHYVKGTSFATPLVAGLIARNFTPDRDSGTCLRQNTVQQNNSNLVTDIFTWLFCSSLSLSNPREPGGLEEIEPWSLPPSERIP